MSKNFEQQFYNSLRKWDLFDDRYPLKDFYIRRPLAILLFRKIAKLFQKELETKGYLPILFPTLIPEKVLQREVDHIQGFSPAVFWVTEIGEKYEQCPERLALAISSETAFCSLFKHWIKFKKDLPQKYYQERTVFRAEAKTIKPLLREKEFLWIEAHTAFAFQHECLKQIQQDREIIEKVLWGKLGLPFIFLERPQWDKCPGAVTTYGFDIIMPNGMVNQVASTHILGQKFSKAFGAKFQNTRNKTKHIHQTSFGIGFSRILGALAGIYKDKEKLLLPSSIMPDQQFHWIRKEKLTFLRKKAGRLADAKIALVQSLKEAENALSIGKVVKAPFCSITMEGRECAEKIFKKSEGCIRGLAPEPFKKEEQRNCIICLRPTRYQAYIARQV